MNTYHPSLDYFLVISKHLNITRAAEELHVSQQNLSIYLKKLEEYYHVQLFVRRPNLQLTPAGNILKESAENIQQIYYSLEQQLKPYTNKKPQITVGCCRARLPNLIDFFHISDYQKQHPDVKIKITEENSTTLEQMLKHHQIDFYIGNSGNLPSNLESFPLMVYPYRVVISQQLLQQYYGLKCSEIIQQWKNGIILKDLVSLPYVTSPIGHLRMLIEQYEKEQNIHFFIAAEHTNPDYRIQMCCHNLGFTISEIPEDSINNMGLVSFPIAEPEIILPLACIRQKNDTRSSYASDLWEIIKEKTFQVREE